MDDGEEVKTSQHTEDNNNRLVQSERVKTSKSESYLYYLHNRISMRMIGQTDGAMSQIFKGSLRNDKNKDAKAASEDSGLADLENPLLGNDH